VRFFFYTICGVMRKPDINLIRTTGVAVSLAAGEEKLPGRIKILNWGENPNCHGKRVFVGPLFVKCLNAETYPFRKVALDFEHNTFPGTVAYKESTEPRPVAGFGTVEVVDGEGVFLNVTAWTPEGEKMAANYTDVSAGALTDDAGNLVAVSSVALCRAGAVEGMDFVEAPLGGDVSSALSGIINNNDKKGEAMDYKALLIKKLGLPEDATDEAILAALEKEPAGKPEGEEGKEDCKAEVAELVKEAVAEAVKPIEEKCAALLAAYDAHTKEDLISAATREGKVIAPSAEALLKMTVDDVKGLVAKTPVTVPLSAITPKAVKETALGAGMSDELKQIAFNCGVALERFNK